MQLMDVRFGQTYYGCVFCRTTRESLVVQTLEEQHPGLKATAVLQIKHKKEQGKKFTVKHTLFPGYVFFKSQMEVPVESFHIQNVIRLLRNSMGSWQLSGMDERFARFIFEHDGILELSQARKIGDKVKVISGPLKELEGYIIKIDRRSGNGQVEFRFVDHAWKVWLAF